MAIDINWSKIRNEVSRLSDVNVLKSEVQKITKEVKNFDYHTILSPSAKKKVKEFEKKYTRVMKSVHSAQRQVDREFNKLFRQVQDHRQTAEQKIVELKNLAETQKQKIDRLAADLKTKVGVSASSKKKKASKKKTTPAKKSSTRKKKA